MSVEDENTGQVKSRTDGGVLDCQAEITQERTLTSCPPPDSHQEENVITDITPSMGEDRKMIEEDILVTLGEGDNMNTDGTSVVSNCQHDDDDCGDPGDMKNDCDDRTEECGDDKTGGVAADDMSGRLCEFKQGWCVYHKIKGDKSQKKVKKWAKKKFGYGWVTSTLIEYTCHLGNSNKPAPDIIQNGDSTRPTALTNSKGVANNCDIPGFLIGDRTEHK